MPPSTQEYKRGPGNSQGNLMKCWGGRSSYEVLSPIFTRLWTFFTSTEFFLYWHIYDATVGIVSEIMVRMYDTTVENYNFNLEKNLIHQVFFCLCLNVIWLKLHPVIFSLESVWKSDFDIVHVLLRAVHRQHVQSAMQRYQARWLLCLTSRCLGSNFRADMYLVCSLISEVLICCLNYF